MEWFVRYSFLDCKTVLIKFFCILKYARAVKQKVWNKAKIESKNVERR